MKTRLLFLTIIFSVFLTSCNVTIISSPEPEITLQEQLQNFELWYVDINATQGNGEIPFLQKAFTVSFTNNGVFANNNIVGIGNEGNGYGLKVGTYTAFGNTLNLNHVLDGFYTLEVNFINFDEIEITDVLNDVTYRLIGYQRDDFDYDALFYDNIEYFLQEYEVWQKTGTSITGAPNAFDAENYLRFFPDQINIFQTSLDKVGTDFDLLEWNFEGNYEVFDVVDDASIKILTLDYDFFDSEDFELTVLDDATVQLLHINSGTVYQFEGRYNIQYLKGNVVKKERKRFKVKRKIKQYKS
jgi:hypothetical protein